MQHAAGGTGRLGRGAAALATVILCSATVVGSPAPVSAAGPPYPFQLVDLPGDGIGFGVVLNESGTFAVAWESPEEYTRINTSNGQTKTFDFGTPMLLDLISNDGRFAYFGGYVESEAKNLIRRVSIDDGTFTDFTVALPADSFLTEVIDSDTSGRWLLVDSSNNVQARSRAYLYDTATQTVVAHDLVDGTKHTYARSLSDDGNVVTYSAIQSIGGITDSVFRWTRSTNSTTRVDAPWGIDPFAGDWVISDDFEWVLYPTSHVPFTLDRASLITGTITSVPGADDDTLFYDLADDGRVLYSKQDDTTSIGTTAQLYLWDGGEPLMLSRGIDERPADWGITGRTDGEFDVNGPGNVVSFESFSINLVAGQTERERNLFIARPPAVGEPNPYAIIQPDERFCVGVKGDPGDFVGLNVTPVFAATPGFGTIHSSDDPAGTTSNVNFTPGSVDPNVAFARIGTDGRICFTNSEHGSVHLIIDQMIVGDASVFSSPTTDGAIRLADTREGLGGPIVLPNERRCLAATGAEPGDFVGVNALVVDASTPGFGTLHSSDNEPGSSSTVNFRAGSFDPNFAFTEVGVNGQICFTNSHHGAVHLILDEMIVGDPAALRSPATPTGTDRPVDTRTGVGGMRLGPAGFVCFNVPGGQAAEFVGVNITPVLASGPGFGTLHSSGVPIPGTSNVNFNVGTVDPNLGLAKLGTDGRACFSNSFHNYVDVIIDAQVIAAASAFRDPTDEGAIRIVDTRIERP